MTTEQTEWVIYKPTGEVFKVFAYEDTTNFYHIEPWVYGKETKRLCGTDCIPCPEPLPQKWAVLITEENWQSFIGYTDEVKKDDAEDNAGLWLQSDGHAWEIHDEGFEEVDYERWKFWEIGAGKEYREKVVTEEIMHQLEYNAYSCKVSWCPICHDHWWPSFACIPCPEPLPRGKYAVLANIYKGAFEEDVWTDFLKDKKVPELDYDFAAYLIFNYFDDKKMLLAATKVTGDIEIVDYDRWHFWHIGAGKEYREKVEKSSLSPEENERVYDSEFSKNLKEVNKQTFESVKSELFAPMSQPDYRTLYEQAQERIGLLEDSVRVLQHDKLHEKAILEAAEAVIKNLEDNFAPAIFLENSESYTHYQQLKAKHNV